MSDLHAESWTLVDQMIRSAISFLAVDATWNALQAPGWADGQLDELQRRLRQMSFLNEATRTFEAERAVGLYWIGRLRQGDMPTWMPATSSAQGWGGRLADRLHLWAWKTLWMESDSLLFLEHYQSTLESLRQLAEGQSYAVATPGLETAWSNLNRRLNGPFKYRYRIASSVIPNWRRAIDTIVKHETLRQLAIAAIGLRRHELRFGTLPDRLDDLRPQFLADLPVDYYDGRSVRYRRTGTNEFLLYSVGANFVDDLGNAPADLIWPKPIWPDTKPE
jgi:hypothetical protein